MTLKQAKKKLGFDQDAKYVVGAAIYAVRFGLELTQKELARRMETHQSLIARAEAMDRYFSTELLERVAKATDTELVITFRKRGEG